MKEYNIRKMLLIGNKKVGKTSLMTQFCHNLFINKYKPTINYEYFGKDFKFKNNLFNLQLWDLAGKDYENFYIDRTFIEDCYGIIFVYDISDYNSYLELKKIINMELFQKVKNIIIVGNKKDLDEREIHYSAGEKLAKDYGGLFIEISSKNNVDELFNLILENNNENKKNDDDVLCFDKRCC